MKLAVFLSVFYGFLTVSQAQGFFLPNFQNLNPSAVLNPVNTADCITGKINGIQRDISVVLGVGNILNDIINENLKDYGICLTTGNGIAAIAEQFTCVVNVVGSVPSDLIRYVNNFQASLGRLFNIGSTFNPCFF